MKKLLLVIVSFAFIVPLCFCEEVKEQDRNYDGKVDRWVYILDENTEKIDDDSDFDGKVNTVYWQYKDSNGMIYKLEMDTDVDGKKNAWLYYNNAIPQKCEADTNKDEVVDITSYMDIAGDILEVEADANYDGKIDLMQQYSGGKVIRTEVDSDFDGKMDKTFNDISEADNWLRENRPGFTNNANFYTPK
ncbi:hypothetical protein ACFL1I_08490 [Candidatus Omnitrophota bacterium]